MPRCSGDSAVGANSFSAAPTAGVPQWACRQMTVWTHRHRIDDHRRLGAASLPGKRISRRHSRATNFISGMCGPSVDLEADD